MMALGGGGGGGGGDTFVAMLLGCSGAFVVVVVVVGVIVGGGAIRVTTGRRAETRERASGEVAKRNHRHLIYRFRIRMT